MTEEFKPPISERSTADLLIILGQEENWQPKAVELARQELAKRNIGEERIQQAKYIEGKEKKLVLLKKAKEGYEIWEFLFDFGPTMFEILFSWELRKDGYIRKAEQQKKIRIGILITVALLIAYMYLTS